MLTQPQLRSSSQPAGTGRHAGTKAPGPIGPNTTQSSLGSQVSPGPHGVPGGAHAEQQLERDAAVPPVATQRAAEGLILQRLSRTQSASDEHGRPKSVVPSG